MELTGRATVCSQSGSFTLAVENHSSNTVTSSQNWSTGITITVGATLGIPEVASVSSSVQTAMTYGPVPAILWFVHPCLVSIRVALERFGTQSSRAFSRVRAVHVLVSHHMS